MANVDWFLVFLILDCIVIISMFLTFPESNATRAQNKNKDYISFRLRLSDEYLFRINSSKILPDWGSKGSLGCNTWK